MKSSPTVSSVPGRLSRLVAVASLGAVLAGCAEIRELGNAIMLTVMVMTSLFFSILPVLAFVLTLVFARRIRRGEPFVDGRPRPTRAPQVLSLIGLFLAGVYAIPGIGFGLENGMLPVAIISSANVVLAIVSLVKSTIDRRLGLSRTRPADAPSPPVASPDPR